jgi:lysophospholipase L1-like esterase
MNALPPDPHSVETYPEQSGATSTNRTVGNCTAAIVALAVAVNLVAILAGYIEFTFRPLLLTSTFDVFLLLVGGALLARGRGRRWLHTLIACVLPFALLAGLEAIAGAVQLSQRISLTQDYSIIKRGSNWGPSMNHLAAEKDGFRLYRPWTGNGVTINDLGLRTVLPTPKSPGEHRIAVTGGSVAWGFRLADDDTIPSLLQATLHRSGHNEITVYNFAIEGATLASELALLKHFKDIYGVDQVVFFTGINDVYSEYFAASNRRPLDASKFLKYVAVFELYKTIDRIQNSWSETPPARMAQIDALISTKAGKNQLVDGVVAANEFCREVGLRCDFVLQPLTVARRSSKGTEAKLAQTYSRLYPGVGVLAAQMYHDALNLGLTDQVHDLTAVFDNSPQQVFIDGGHVNEAGNITIVDALLPIVTSTPVRK